MTQSEIKNQGTKLLLDDNTEYIDNIQKMVVNNIIAEESEKVTNFFNGSFLEHKTISVHPVSGLISVVLKFNYCGDKYNYNCLPYSSFIIQGMTVVYKDQNVFCWELEDRDVKGLNDKAKVFFNSMLNKLNS